MNSKGFERKQSWPNPKYPKYYPYTDLEGLSKTTKK
jgi:hypothetical protein